MTEATRVIAIRHGETAWNVEARIQGHLDVALNDTGRRQAAHVARALADDSIAMIYASDLLRAHDTARAIAAGTGARVVTDTGLRERGFGVFEGLTFSQVEQQWPDAALRWRRRDPAFGPEAGETLAEFYDRALAAACRIAERHAGQTIAIVSHGGVLDCLYRAASRLPLDAPRTWQLGNASINRLLYADVGFTLIGWSDTMHLDAAAAGVGDGDAGLAAVADVRGRGWR